MTWAEGNAVVTSFGRHVFTRFLNRWLAQTPGCSNGWGAKFRRLPVWRTCSDLHRFDFRHYLFPKGRIQNLQRITTKEIKISEEQLLELFFMAPSPQVCERPGGPSQTELNCLLLWPELSRSRAAELAGPALCDMQAPFHDLKADR